MSCKQRRPSYPLQPWWLELMPLPMPEPEHPDEGFDTNIEPPKQPETVSDSRQRLEQAARVSFHENAEAESLVDLVKIYDEARDQRTSKRLRELLKLRKRTRELGAEVSDFELERYDDSPARDVITSWRRRWSRC